MSSFLLDKIIFNLKNRWNNGSERSRLAIKNIVLSVFLKCTSIITSLLIVPMTISYIDASQYGIWLTISSIVAWANFFDLGLANGFRNRFAQAKAKGDDRLAQEYVSTTYAVISSLMITVLVIIIIINHWIDWAKLLNVDEDYRFILSKVFSILFIFFCMNMIVNIFVKLLEADQRPAIASLISCIGQILSLGSIFILTRFTEGSLLKLALYFSSIPFFTMLIASILMFNYSRYRLYKPTISSIKLPLISNIMGLGVKFFLIYLCLIVVFHLINIILSREVGPLAVTQYNIANKYFSIVYMLSVIIVSPMWSAFTDAYEKRDFNWMRSTLKKLEVWYFLAFCICCLACIASPICYKLWIGEKVSIPFILSIAVMLLMISQIGGNIFTTIICGLGHMRLQTIIYVISALIAFPIMTYSCRKFGVIGIVIVPTIVYTAQTIVCRYQLWKIINKTASGIWLK